jgi:hypothetical protein
MNRTQHFVLVLYCLLLAYCCLWLPWHVQRSSRFDTFYVRSGYGWLWTGPKKYCPSPPSDHTANLCNLDNWTEYDETATPDLQLLALRLVAATAIGSAVFVLAKLLTKSATLS